MILDLVSFFIFVFIGFCGFTLAKIIFKSYMSPLGIYSLVWCLMGSSYNLMKGLRLLPYTDVELTTLVVIFTSWVAFTMGSLLSIIVPKREIKMIQIRVDILERYIILLAVVALLMSLMFVMKTLEVFGLSSYLETPWSVRAAMTVNREFQAERSIGVFGQGIAFAGTAMGAAYLAITGRASPIAFFPAVSIIIYSSAFLGRAFIAQALFMYLSGYTLSKMKVRNIFPARKIVAWQYAVFISFVGLIHLLGLWTGRGSAEEEFVDLGVITPLVHYINRIASPLITLDAVLSQPPPMLGGQATFRPIAKLLYEVGLMDTYIEYFDLALAEDPIFGWPISYLTYTFLRPFYDDFGPIGTLVIPFLIGFVSTLLFARTLSVFSAIILIFLYTALIYSFGTWLFSSSEFTIGFFLGSTIGFLIDRSPRISARGTDHPR